MDCRGVEGGLVLNVHHFTSLCGLSRSYHHIITGTIFIGDKRTQLYLNLNLIQPSRSKCFLGIEAVATFQTHFKSFF